MEHTGATRLSIQSAFIVAAVVLSIALGSSPARAQAPVGTISGVVSDTSGAVMSGATVTASSLSTGVERVTTANSQGFFTIPSLKPGEYKLTVKSTGFADFVMPRVVVEVGQTARIDVASGADYPTIGYHLVSSTTVRSGCEGAVH